MTKCLIVVLKYFFFIQLYIPYLLFAEHEESIHMMSKDFCK